MSRQTFHQRWTIVLVATLAWAALPARCVHAESVYKCRVADGAVAFQDRPCADARTQSVVDIAPSPTVTPSPEYGRAPGEGRVARGRGTLSAHAGGKPARETMSYACHAADGELFYRHGACPKQIPARGASNGGSRGRAAKTTQTVGVTAQALPRSEVCRKLASAGSIGRAGHEHDENVSTYDRNLGRDPCRYL